MNARKLLSLCLAAVMLTALAGCGQAPQPAEKKAGVVYLDPNAAAPAPTQRTTEAPAASAVPEAPAKATDAPAVPTAEPAEEADAEGEPEVPLDLYFEGKGVRLEPWMEAAPALAALGEPIGSFEADSCAYIGKDLFYYYPGFELTVNEVEGVNRITVITVADDTVTIPQGLRIYDDEEKLLSILGGTDEDGIYSYRSGNTLLLIQVKSNGDDGRRIASMEYHMADDQ